MNSTAYCKNDEYIILKAQFQDQRARAVYLQSPSK